MSYTSVGRNKVYASIEDLPENQKLVDGDRIIIQTDDGTALVDFANIKIDLAHVTFGTQVSQLIEFTSTVEQFIDEINSEFESLKEETSNIKSTTKKLEEQLEGCKLLLKFILGSANSYSKGYIEQLVNGLPTEGLNIYEECIDAVKLVAPDFEFNKYHLLNSGGSSSSSTN